MLNHKSLDLYETDLMKHIILASTSTVFGSGFLEYLLPELERHFDRVDEIVFIPYARPNGISHSEYTKKVESVFNKIGKSVVGLHEYQSPQDGIQEAQGIFTGGGNTFVLVKALYDHRLMPILRDSLLKGTPYLGTSAGSNICGQTLGTTNDMPIVYPPSFDTLKMVDFNINPHYLDPDPSSTHMGETRETRIHEFHQFNDIPVVGLREGSFLEIYGNDVILKGNREARIFEKGRSPYEIPISTNLNTLK